MLESKFKLNQREHFEKLGWKFITLDPGGGVPKGFPDTLCLSPTGYSCYVEWKQSAKAKKQSLQEHWNNKLNEMGHHAFFVCPENVEMWRAYIISESRAVSR